MNQYEEDRLARKAKIWRDRSIVLGHKYSAQISEYLELEKTQKALEQSLLDALVNIKLNSWQAAENPAINADLDVRSNYRTIANLPFDTISFDQIVFVVTATSTLGSIIGDFLLFEYSLKALDKVVTRSFELRRLLAPAEVEEFTHPNGQVVTIFPAITPPDTSLYRLKFSQSDTVKKLTQMDVRAS